MRTRLLASFATTALVLGLACGGGLGSSVGPYATSMAEHFESENPGIPCPTFNIGDELKVGDWTLRVDEAKAYEPESALPYIQNSTERSAMKGAKAIGIAYSLRNDTPLAKKWDLNMNCITPDGNKSRFWPYNEKLLASTLGITEVEGNMPPGKWIQAVAVCSGTPEALDGAVFRPFYQTKEYDPTDPRGKRKIDVLHAQAVVDLGPLADGGHINPANR